MKRWRKLAVCLAVCVMITGCSPYNAGVKNLKKGEYSEAAVEFTEAIEKEKNLADSYRGLGIALWEEEDYQGAYDAFENALANDTEVNATFYSLFANSAMEIEKYDKACEYFELALTMEDISEELQKETEYNLIAAYEYAGDVEAAKQKVTEYLEKYPEDESVLREAQFLETR